MLRSLGNDVAFSDFPKAIESFAAAAEFLGEALSLNLLYSSARWNLAQTLFDMGLFSEAIDMATKLLACPVICTSEIVSVARKAS